MSYYAVVTNKGNELIAAAIQSGVALEISKMCVGDGNGKAVTPNVNQTSLVN